MAMFLGKLWLRIADVEAMQGGGGVVSGFGG